MPTYAVAGIAIAADLALPELPEAEGAEPTWHVHRGRVPSGPELSTVYELRTPDGVLWGVLAAGEGAYRLTFPAHVEFHVDVASASVTYAPVRELAEITLRHLIVDQMIPHLLAIGGALVLHASCVSLDGAAIAFVGPTGVGKSSLAAAFVQRGATLLADDYVLLTEADGGYLAAPAYPGLRLWEDSAEHFAGSPDQLPRVSDYTSKRRWAAPTGADPDELLPLRALIAPGNEPEPGRPDVLVDRLRGADAFMVLYQQAFRMERAGRDRQTAELDRFVALAARVPVLLVEHRRDYALLPEVINAILEAVGKG